MKKFTLHLLFLGFLFSIIHDGYSHSSKNQDMVIEDNTSFVTTWKTDNPGTSNNSSIRIPTYGYGYNYHVDWDNHGILDEFNLTGSVIHDFGSPGTYTIRIRGTFPQIYFYYNTDREKILSVDQWGDISWRSMERAFYGCVNLVVNATDAPDLSNVSNMSYMFTGTRVLIRILPLGFTPVNNMSGMFQSQLPSTRILEVGMSARLQIWETCFIIQLLLMKTLEVGMLPGWKICIACFKMQLLLTRTSEIGMSAR